jgi:acyl-CoA thioester hydrolase
MMQAPQVPPSDQLKFSAQVQTRWSDEDMQGVLNNAVIATLLEEARYQYFEQLGMLASDHHFTFVLLQSNIRFLAPGHGPCTVRVEMATVHLGLRSFRQVYRVLDSGSGSVWAEAEALCVIWDPQHRSSAQIPADFRQKVVDFEGIAATD